jgi:hypothetical protein
VKPLDSFPAFYGTRFSLPRSQELSTCTYPEPIRSTPPHPTSTRSVVVLSTQVRVGLPSSLLPSGFLTNNLYVILFSPIRATCLTYFILLDLVIVIILGEVTNHATSGYVVFSTLLLLRHKYFPQHPVPKHPQSMFFL